MVYTEDMFMIIPYSRPIGNATAPHIYSPRTKGGKPHNKKHSH